MVTGASSGIGLAIANRFLCEGAAKIVLVGRNKKRLEDAVKLFDQAGHMDNGQGNIPGTTSSGREDTTQKISDVGSSFSLVTGDVGDPSFWCHDVQKLMVNYPPCFLDLLKVYIIRSIAYHSHPVISGHPGKRSRSLTFGPRPTRAG